MYVSNRYSPYETCTPDEVCTHLGDQWRSPVIVRAHCNTPIAGRYIMLRRTVSGSMNFCELSAIGYRYHPCERGYYGIACKDRCNCRDDCNDITGACSTMCQPGWKKPDCQIPCDDGQWGTDCLEFCHCFDPGEVCAKDYGVCASGCADGYAGPSCRETCRGGKVGGRCIEPSLNGVIIDGHVNITEVTVTWSRPNATILFLYSIHWRAITGSPTEWSSGEMVPEPFYTQALPYINTIFELRAVPYETVSLEPGVPSETVTVVTGCHGERCEEMCYCITKPSQLCLRTSPICYATCSHDRLGNICDIYIPGVVGDIEVSDVTNTSAVCSFMVSSGEDHELVQMPIIQYEVKYSPDNFFWLTQNIEIADNNNDSNYTIQLSQLTHNRQYFVTLTPVFLFNNIMYRGFTSNVFTIITGRVTVAPETYSTKQPASADDSTTSYTTREDGPLITSVTINEGHARSSAVSRVDATTYANTEVREFDGRSSLVPENGGDDDGITQPTPSQTVSYNGNSAGAHLSSTQSYSTDSGSGTGTPVGSTDGVGPAVNGTDFTNQTSHGNDAYFTGSTSVTQSSDLDNYTMYSNNTQSTPSSTYIAETGLPNNTETPFAGATQKGDGLTLFEILLLVFVSVCGLSILIAITIILTYNCGFNKKFTTDKQDAEKTQNQSYVQTHANVVAKKNGCAAQTNGVKNGTHTNGHLNGTPHNGIHQNETQLNGTHQLETQQNGNQNGITSKEDVNCNSISRSLTKDERKMHSLLAGHECVYIVNDTIS